MEIEIPKGSNNWIKIDKNKWNNAPKSEQMKFYRQKESEYKLSQAQQDIEATKQKNLEAETSTTGEKIAGTLRGAGQGLTFGFGDEIEAGLKTGFGLLGDYGKTVGDIRQDIDDFRVSDPALAYGSEIGGAIVPALFTGGAGAVATAGRMGVGALAKQGAKTGAKFGGAYGVGTAESDPGASVFEMAKDRAIGLGGGATLGAVTGGVLNPAISKTLSGMSGLKNQLAKFQGKDQAIEKDVNRTIASALNKESDEAIKKVVDDTVSPTMLADVGTNPRGLAYAMQQISNPNRTQIADDLVARNNEQSSRILNTIKQTSNISDDKLGYEFIDTLDDQVQRLAKPQYDEAYKVNIPANKFKSLFGSTKVDAILEASREGLKASRRQGYDVPDLNKIFKVNPKNGNASFDELMTQDLPTSYLHSIKKGLDKLVERNTDKITNKMNSTGREYQIIKQELNDIMKNNNPAYAKANKEFADVQKLREAFERGQKYKTTTIRKIEKDLSKMTPGEQEAWKSGMVTKIEDIAQSKRDSANFLSEVDGSDKLGKIFNFLVKDKNQKQAFDNIIKSEKNMAETFKILNQNSNTATKEAFKSEFAESQKSVFDADTTYGAVRNIARQGLRKGKDVLQGGTNSERAKLISERLFATDKATQKQVLDQLKITNKELAEEVQKRLDKALQLTKFGTRSIAVGLEQ